MGRGLQQHLALAQGLGHEAEFVGLEIAKPAMDQLGAGGRGMGGKIVLLAQGHRQAAPGGVAGDARAVDPAADDKQIAQG